MHLSEIFVFGRKESQKEGVWRSGGGVEVGQCEAVRGAPVPAVRLLSRVNTRQLCCALRRSLRRGKSTCQNSAVWLFVTAVSFLQKASWSCVVSVCFEMCRQVAFILELDSLQQMITQLFVGRRRRRHARSVLQRNVQLRAGHREMA